MKKITKAHCNTCFGEKNHELLHVEESKETELMAEDIVFYSGESFELLKCGGCNSIKLRHNNWHSAECDDDGNYVIHTTYFPPSVSRREPDWMSFCLDPRTPEFLFREVYIALQNDCRRLAAMGVRSIIEYIMVEQIGGDYYSFEKNLENFQEGGFISVKQKEILETIIDAGNATTHRGFEPSAIDLSNLLEIAESLYETVYLHQSRADSLKKRIPPKQPRKK